MIKCLPLYICLDENDKPKIGFLKYAQNWDVNKNADGTFVQVETVEELLREAETYMKKIYQPHGGKE